MIDRKHSRDSLREKLTGMIDRKHSRDSLREKLTGMKVRKLGNIVETV